MAESGGSQISAIVAGGSQIGAIVRENSPSHHFHPFDFFLTRLSAGSQRSLFMIQNSYMQNCK